MSYAPLATAYRGLGQLDNAQPHLRQWRNRDLPVPEMQATQLGEVLHQLYLGYPDSAAARGEAATPTAITGNVSVGTTFSKMSSWVLSVCKRTRVGPLPVLM